MARARNGAEATNLARKCNDSLFLSSHALHAKMSALLLKVSPRDLPEARTDALVDLPCRRSDFQRIRFDPSRSSGRAKRRPPRPSYNRTSSHCACHPSNSSLILFFSFPFTIHPQLARLSPPSRLRPSSERLRRLASTSSTSLEPLVPSRTTASVDLLDSNPTLKVAPFARPSRNSLTVAFQNPLVPSCLPKRR